MRQEQQARVAVVTGAGGGIGLAICKELAQAGCDIVVTDVRAEALEPAAKIVEECGRQSLSLVADVCVAEQVDALVNTVLERFGRLDILVNNAGITRDGLLLRMRDEQWDQVLNTNLRGPFLCTRAASRPMVRQNYGRIINMSSIVGLIGNAGQSNYAAAKAGLIGLTRTAAKELAGKNVTVNAVAPGFIETPLLDPLRDKLDALLQRVPLRRLGQPEEVAYVVGWLASDRAAYITGQVIVIDGGLTLA